MFRSTLNLKLKINYRIEKRFKWTKEKCTLFENLFELRYGSFKSYRVKNKIPLLSEEHIISNAAFCSSLDIAKDEWVKFPELVKCRSNVLEQRYLHLKESGFTSVGAEVLAKYRKCVSKRVDFLKQFNFIPKDTNVAKSLSSYLFPQPTDMYIDDLTDDNVFEEIHYKIRTRYLMWKFEATEDEIKKFYRIYNFSNVKSFDFLCQNFNFLKELGYSMKKVMRHGYVLAVNPRSPKELLDGFSQVSKINLLEGMKVHPKLITASLKNCTEIHSYLKELEIDDSTIQNCLGLFTLSPSTVKLRLSEIRSVPDLQVLLNDLRTLKLIVRHCSSRSKLSFLKNLKMKCIPFSAIGSNEQTLKSFVARGSDINATSDLINLLNRLLGTQDGCTVIRNLKKHRFYRHVPLMDIERNYELLTELHFDKQAIEAVVQILLYPSNKLKETYEKIQTLYPPAKKLTNVQQLNLIIYFMEKEHSFSGNGVWNNCEDDTDFVL